MTDPWQIKQRSNLTELLKRDLTSSVVQYGSRLGYHRERKFKVAATVATLHSSVHCTFTTVVCMYTVVTLQ